MMDGSTALPAPLTAEGQGTRRQMLRRGLAGAASLLPATAVVAACSPTVRVEAPDRPIEINLNIRIDQEVRIRLDRELDSLFTNNPDLF